MTRSLRPRAQKYPQVVTDGFFPWAASRILRKKYHSHEKHWEAFIAHCTPHSHEGKLNINALSSAHRVWLADAKRLYRQGLLSEAQACELEKLDSSLLEEARPDFSSGEKCKRAYFVSSTKFERIASLMCFLGFIAFCLVLSTPLLPSLCALGIVTLLIVSTICDERAHILPLELTGMIWILSLIFSLVSFGIIATCINLLGSLALFGVLKLASLVTQRFVGTQGIGRGDVRLLPALPLLGELCILAFSLLVLVLVSIFRTLYERYTKASEWHGLKTRIPMGLSISSAFICSLVLTLISLI